MGVALIGVGVSKRSHYKRINIKQQTLLGWVEKEKTELGKDDGKLNVPKFPVYCCVESIANILMCFNRLHIIHACLRYAVELHSLIDYVM